MYLVFDRHSGQDRQSWQHKQQTTRTVRWIVFPRQNMIFGAWELFRSPHSRSDEPAHSRTASTSESSRSSSNKAITETAASRSRAPSTVRPSSSSERGSRTRSSQHVARLPSSMRDREHEKQDRDHNHSPIHGVKTASSESSSASSIVERKSARNTPASPKHDHEKVQRTPPIKAQRKDTPAQDPLNVRCPSPWMSRTSLIWISFVCAHSSL